MKGLPVPPRVIRIYSENSDYQHIETLRRNRAKRQRHRELFVEGVRPINLALRHGWQVNAFVYAPERPLSDWAAGILRRSSARAHVELPARLLEQLSLKDEPSELLAVLAMPEDRLERIPVSANPLVVVFDRPGSPGNLGTLIRSCDALGADGLVVTGHACDLYDPETIRASTGSLFALPSVRLPSHAVLLPWLDALRAAHPDLQVVGADERGERAIAAHDFTRPTVLLLGNETWGLSQAYRQLADALVRIPIGGDASSLNVAVAGSIILYEVGRQRDR
ncbi:MAG TPA: RNA methyltransferase [Roseiflexaceae bacterium]|nr:RNA methyltransferase [Roseiflexaceae bacterium]